MLCFTLPLVLFAAAIFWVLANMDPYLLHDIVRDIECHPDCDRIKKLMHWVYTETWCQDPATLTVGPLISGLVTHATTPVALQKWLLNGAQQLNKPKQYHQLGLMLAQQLAPLYDAVPVARVKLPKVQDPRAKDPRAKDPRVQDPRVQNPRVKTPKSVSPPPATTFPSPSPTQSPGRSTGETSGQDQTHEYDLFEVRLAVLKYTTPLKAKILLSAVLDQQILTKPRHWLWLKQYSLDELLQRLYTNHPHWEDLNQALMEAAEPLYSIDQIQQVVQAIGQAFKPLCPSLGNTSQAQRLAPLPPLSAAWLEAEDLEEMTSVIMPAGGLESAP